MAALLEVHGLEAGYGKSQVLFGMALEIGEHSIATFLTKTVELGPEKAFVIHGCLPLAERIG